MVLVRYNYNCKLCRPVLFSYSHIYMNTYLRNIKPNAMCAQFPFTRLFDKYCLFRRAHYISAYIPHAHIKNTFRFVNNTTVMRRYLFSLLYYYYSK